MNRPISVFGATGFIGSRFCELNKDLVLPIPRDSRSPQSDEILYFISTVDNYNIHQDLHIDIDTNLSILMEVLEQVKKNPNTVFNFVSSWFVYGQNEKIPFREDTSPCNPTGFYSITKYCAEQMLICFCKTFNIKYRIFRLANVLGAGDNKISKKKNALQYLIKELVNDREIELYYDGNVLRDYMHVDDVCSAINVCINNAPYNEIINIGRGEPLLFRDIINQAVEVSNSKSNIVSVEPTTFHNIVQVRHSYLDTTKLKSYGHTLTFGINDIVKELVEFYKSEIKVVDM